MGGPRSRRHAPRPPPYPRLERAFITSRLQSEPNGSSSTEKVPGLSGSTPLHDVLFYDLSPHSHYITTPFFSPSQSKWLVMGAASGCSTRAISRFRVGVSDLAKQDMIPRRRHETALLPPLQLNRPGTQSLVVSSFQQWSCQQIIAEPQCDKTGFVPSSSSRPWALSALWPTRQSSNSLNKAGELPPATIAFTRQRCIDFSLQTAVSDTTTNPEVASTPDCTRPR